MSGVIRADFKEFGKYPCLNDHVNNLFDNGYKFISAFLEKPHRNRIKLALSLTDSSEIKDRLDNVDDGITS